MSGAAIHVLKICHIQTAHGNKALVPHPPLTDFTSGYVSLEEKT